MRSCATYLCPEMADRLATDRRLLLRWACIQPSLILIVSIVPESRAQSGEAGTRHAIRISSREVRIARRVCYRKLTRDGCWIRDVTRVSCRNCWLISSREDVGKIGKSRGKHIFLLIIIWFLKIGRISGYWYTYTQQSITWQSLTTEYKDVKRFHWIEHRDEDVSSAETRSELFKPRCNSIAAGSEPAAGTKAGWFVQFEWRVGGEPVNFTPCSLSLYLSLSPFSPFSPLSIQEEHQNTQASYIDVNIHGIYVYTKAEGSTRESVATSRRRFLCKSGGKTRVFSTCFNYSSDNFPQWN